MSMQQQRSSSQEEYHDTPQPSRFFVLSFIFFPILLCIILGLIAFSAYGTPKFIASCVGLAFPALVCIGFSLLLLRAGYNTTYRLSNQVLELSNKPYMFRQLALSKITAIEKARRVPRLLGVGVGTVGACNRYSNGVRLTVPTAGKNVYWYLTPSDPDAFIDRLNEIRASDNRTSS